MRYRICVISLLLSVLGQCVALCQDDLGIWRDFMEKLRSGRITPEMLRPYPELGEEFRPVLMGFLDSMRVQAAEEDWSREPEVVRSEDRIHYLLPWGSGDRKANYCFSFVKEGAEWHFQHMEAIFIRLDKIGELPASKFPDVSEGQKSWAREEIYWSFLMLNVYLPVSQEKGRDAALSMLKDGGGYFMGAKAWVPFTTPQRAFILYLCWEQANLRGNQVTLLKLGDTEAVLRLSTYYFAVYFAASHLKTKIPLDEYTQIFETIWQDRARAAGWHLEISYAQDRTATFHFRRKI